MDAKDKIKEVLKYEGKDEEVKRGAGQPQKYSDPVKIDFKLERSLKLKAKKLFGRNLADMFNLWLLEKVNDAEMTNIR